MISASLVHCCRWILGVGLVWCWTEASGVGFAEADRQGYTDFMLGCIS